MTNFLKTYGDTEGPFGLPMKDKQARALEQILKAIPQEDQALCHAVIAKAPTEVLDGERSDVSWISTETADHENEIVIAKGMNDSQFAANPLVTMQHCYESPPVGRSLWRKRAKDGAVAGVKAKTIYPTRPADWTEDCWPPDVAFSLIKAGLLNGKSVGFIRLASHAPTSHEIAARPELANVRRIIDEWLLVEYAVCFLPTNPGALVEAVSKAQVKLPPDWIRWTGAAPDQPLGEGGVPSDIPFTSLTEVEAAVRRSFSCIDTRELIDAAVKAACHQVRGGV